jgi:hypothetical protein
MNFWKQLVNKYPLIGNKFVLTLIAFVVWVTFLDNNSLLRQYRDRQHLFELQKEKKYYQDELKVTQVRLNELLSDSKSLEKFAREQHLMKRANEDIWLVIDQNEPVNAE